MFIKETLTTLLNVARDGVVLVGPTPDAPIVTHNTAFTYLCQLPDQSFNGKSWWDVLTQAHIPTTTIDIMRRLWKPPKEQGTPVLYGEFSLLNSQENDRIIEWVSTFQPQLTCYVFSFYDVTAERMGDRLRTDLISRVSHELRTPLTAISGFAEFILEMSADELPTIAREYTEIILTSARHLSGVFTDIIEFSRVNSGAVELYLTSAQIQDIITQIIARLDIQAVSREHKIVLELDQDVPPTMVDVDRLNQVITQLLINATKYAPIESEIKISMRLVNTRADLPKSAPKILTLPAVMVSVIDAGTGVDKSEIQNIFLPFYRAPNADAQQVEGAGLGLAIAHRLISLHHGTIWAEAGDNNEHSGGRFFFTLPLVDTVS